MRYSILGVLSFLYLFCINTAAALTPDPGAGVEPGGGFSRPVEQRFQFSDGPDNYSTLSYSSPYTSGDSLSAMVANGLSYSFTQRAGRSFLHFALNENSSGSHKVAGGTFGRLRLSFLHGDGDGLSSHKPAINGIASNFFHGAASRPYRYTGSALAWSWTNKLASHAGSVNIDAPDVNSRSVHFAGAALGNFSATLYQIERDVSVGRGLSVGWRTRSFSFGYQALESDARASWHEASAAYHDRRGGTFRMSLSAGRNDLYAGARDNRVALTYRISFGAGGRHSRAPAFGHDFNAGGAALSFDDLSRIGIGAVGAGLVVSSGDPVLDQAPRYPTQPHAAYSILSLYNPISVSRNLEYGGSIYRNPDGTFSPSQQVVEGTPNSVGFNPHTLVPPGMRASAAWHTHGATDPRYVNEFFSPADIQFAQFYTVDMYLATPMGRMFEYVLVEDTIYQYVAPDHNEFILPH